MKTHILIVISLIIYSTFLISAYDCNIRTKNVLVSNDKVFFSLALINSTGGGIPNSPQVVINSSCYDMDGNSISSPTFTSVGNGEWLGILTTSVPGVCHFNATNSGTVCAGDNAVWSMLNRDINITVWDINTTIYKIYDFLLDDMNETLTSILNFTNLTYFNVVNLKNNISDLDNDLSSLRTYLEDKWGNEDANEIIDRLKDIRSDVTYLRSRYYSISEEEKRLLLLSIREDSRKILDLIYGQDKWWEGLLIWIIPAIILILLIILIVWLIKRKNKKQVEDFEGNLNER